jgi:hypothetical protein
MILKLLAIMLYAVKGLEYDQSYVEKCYDRYPPTDQEHPAVGELRHLCLSASHFKQLFLLCQFPEAQEQP